jgi:hypothetical protein
LHHNEVVGICLFCSFDTLLIRCTLAGVLQVCHYRVGEQERFLQHLCNLDPETVLPDLFDILAIDNDLAVIDIIIASENVDDRALAGTGRTTETKDLSRQCMERVVMQDTASGNITEIDMIKYHITFHNRHRRSTRLVGNHRFFVHNLKDP